MRFPWKRRRELQGKEELRGSLNLTPLADQEPVQEPVEEPVPEPIRDPVQEPVVAETESIAPKPYNRINHVGNIHWMDDLIMEHQKQGGFDNLSGKGKPLNFDPKADVFSGILKNTGAMPPWIAFQQEIRADIQRAITSMQSKSTFDLDKAITQINDKIRKFNTQCPTPLLQKRLVSRNDIVQRLKDWE